MNVQLLILIIVTFSLYALVAFAFSITYSISKFFNLTLAIEITFAPYLFYELYSVKNFQFLVALFLSILSCVILQYIFNRYIFLKFNKNRGFPKLLSSLGLYIVFQNIISLLFGDQSFKLSIIHTKSIYLSKTVITNNQIIIICVSLLILALGFLIILKTKLGRHFRAVSSNSELAHCFGIDTKKVIYYIGIISSIIISLAGILFSSNTVLYPTMGFNLLLYGIVAMIIGGIGSTWGLIGGSLLLATAQHLGAYYIDSKWMDAIAYIILILFLIWKPLGFSGKRLKKIEI